MRRLYALFSLIPAGMISGEVVINEIHYHPVEEPDFLPDFNPVMDLSEDVHEFIELHNTGDGAVSLANWELTKGVRFTFPAGASIEAGGFVVVAKNPSRLLAITEYDALTAHNVFGPWTGGLSNSGERIVLQNATQETIDEVEYGSEFPWPVTADGLGETRRWADLDLDLVQYRGSSLERVSTSFSGNALENWRASVPLSNPSPGKANAILADVPDPVVTFLDLQQSDNGEPVIRPSKNATVSCAFSSEEGFSRVVVEYFVDNIETTNETVFSVTMSREVSGQRVLYQAELPGHAAGQIIRYRIKATREEGDPVLSPRVNDPYDWYAYSPWSGATDGKRYEVYYSSASESEIDGHVNLFDPNRLSDIDYFGESRSAGWNGTAPGVFVRDGEVWDVHLRYQGSPYFRWFAKFAGNVPRLKIKFPRDHRMDGERSILLTDKENETLDAHRLFQHLGLPISYARRVSVTANGGRAESMIELGGMNGSMLDQYYDREKARNGIAVPDDPGWIVKASGLFDDSGPWGSANGLPLIERFGYLALERYAWTYPLKNQDWRGYVPFHQMLLDHPGVIGAPSELQNFFNAQWDVSRALDYYAAAEWGGIWDDDVHNYFYYRTPSGRWIILPWDFDEVFASRNLRSHVFESTIKTAFPTAYADRLYHLNNTLMDQSNLIANKITFRASDFASARQSTINERLDRGAYVRPITPILKKPLNGGGHHPALAFETSEYLHPDGKTHTATLWEFRTEEGDYLNPVYRHRSESALTGLTLPPDSLKVGQRYYWRVTYIDSEGHESLISVEQFFTAGAFNEFPGAIRLGEIVAHNSETTEHDGQFPDWVEIHNVVSVELPLGGMTLLSDPNGPVFAFPEGAVIPAGGRVIVWLSEPVVGGTGFYSGFGLSKDGDSLILRSADGTESDSVTFGPQPDGTSLAKDGSMEWKLSVPTPLAANEAVSMGHSSAIRFTEWLADPQEGDDWLEIQNTSPLPVAIGGLIFEDSSGEKTSFPPHSFIAAGEYLQLIADGNAENGPDHLGFSLSSDREEVFVREADGTLIDRIFFWDQEEGVSEGLLDDLVDIARFTVPSPGRKNLPPDRDADGIPDIWEDTFGLNADLAADAALDSDADGFSNLEEYSANTDPFDSVDFLTTTVQRLNANVILFTFSQKAGRAYAIEISNGKGSWETLKMINPEATPRIRLENIAVYPDGVYRVRASLPE
ncbi:MAG: lamin tail domain-containing protein [Akkermansiaceae bacterium]